MSIRRFAVPLAVAIAAAASYGIGWLTGWPAAGAVVLAVLVLSLWRFWLPIRYELGSQGIAQTVLGRTIRVPWTAILNYRVRTGGVMLYSDAVLTPLAPLRALYLPWGRQKEQVLSQVDYYLSTWAHSERSGGRA